MSPIIVTKIKPGINYDEVFCENGKTFLVKSFLEDMVTVEAVPNESIHGFARIVEGCFLRDSNFSKMVSRRYGSFQKIRKVKVVFNWMKEIFDVDKVCEKDIVEAYKRNTLE